MREAAEPESEWRRCMAAAAAAAAHGRLAEAEEQYRDALRMAEQFGEEDLRLADSLSALGELFSRHGSFSRDRESAEVLLRRALAIRERALGPEHPEVARILVALASSGFPGGPQAERADAARAAELLERAIAIEAQATDLDRDLLALTSNAVTNLSGSLSLHGKAAEAEALHHHLIALHEKRHGPDCAGAAMARINLACFYEGRGRLADAEAQLSRALAILRTGRNAGGGASTAFQFQHLASLCHKQSRWPEAAELFRETLAALEATWGPEAPGLIHILASLAEVCLGLGEYDEAERLVQRARTIEGSASTRRFGPGSALQKIQVDLLKVTGRYQEAWELERDAQRRPGGPPDVSDSLRRRVPLPRPDPDQQPEFVWITALTVGCVTEHGAAVRWQTSGEVPSSLWQRQSHPGGSRRSGGFSGAGRTARDHAASVQYGEWPDPGEVEVEVFTSRADQDEVDRIAVTLVPPRVPAEGGKPCLRVESRVRALGRSELVEIEIRLMNEGDGEALRTRIDQVTIAEGWELLTASVGGEPLPNPVNLGRIGPSSAGVLIVRLRRRAGAAEPMVTIQAVYLSIDGARLTIAAPAPSSG